MDLDDKLRTLEKEAYVSVLRALAATPMDWNKEKLLTELRKELHIEPESHYEVLNSVMDDPYIMTIRQSFTKKPPGAEGPSGLARVARPTDSTPSAGQARGNGRQGARGGPRAAAAAAAAAAADAVGPPQSVSPSAPASAGALVGVGKARLGGGAGKRIKRPAAALEDEIPAVGREAVGRRVWRYWPGEGVHGWVRGDVTSYRAAKGDHIITYDKGTKNQSYEYYNFSLASPQEYSFDLVAPYEQAAAGGITPAAAAGAGLAAGGSARGKAGGAAAAAAPAPKRARAAAVREMGTAAKEGAPFDPATFKQQLGAAGVEQLRTMLLQLQRRERELQDDIAGIEDEDKALEPAVCIQHQIERLAHREKLLQAQLVAAVED